LLVEKRLNRAHGVRTWLGASVVTVLLLCVFAAPISAASPATTLSGATVSPRSGTPSTTIVITVTYKNKAGARPDRVTAKVGSVERAMTGPATGDWRTGVVFRWSGKVPVGTYPVTVSAQASKNRGDASLAAGTLKISPVPAPTPKPTPKPKATPKPTPKPTARATVKPARTPGPVAEPTSGSLAGPGLLPTPGPNPLPRPFPTATAPPLIVALGGIGGIGGTGGPGDPGGPGTPGSDGRSGPTGGPGQPSGRGWGPLAGLLAMAGLQGPNFTGLTVVPTLVTTTGAVALGMAFGLFGRRRREDESDDSLSAAAASGVGFMASSAVAVGTVDGIAAASGAVLDVDDTEALMPRWRRPSLIQARKADPIRDTGPAARLTFDHGLVGPLDGRERKVIRYRVVRLLDSPDELRGSEIGYLDQGDEVQLIEKYGAYWLVLSPDGQQGWLHKMTLGDVYEEDSPPPSERPVATMPVAAETWTMGEADIDGDVFEAYLESRRRRGE